MRDAARVSARPALFRALGKSNPPSTVTVMGADYALHTILKHDSWAATAIYIGADGTRIICKFNRLQPALIIPLSWLGTILARREAGFTRRLAHLDRVPRDMGAVSVNGRVLPNAIARSYIEGEPFHGASSVDAAFFADLRRTLDAVHVTGMAYVDLHKRENIIIDTAGRPNLIDFQVSLGLTNHWPGNGALKRFIVGKLQEMDDYHYRKHYARCLPELLTPAEIERYLEPPGFLRAHRKVAVPLRALRRRLLTLLNIRDKTGMASSEHEPEDAFRAFSKQQGKDEARPN